MVVGVERSAKLNRICMAATHRKMLRSPVAVVIVVIVVGIGVDVTAAVAVAQH